MRRFLQLSLFLAVAGAVVWLGGFGTAPEAASTGGLSGAASGPTAGVEGTAGAEWAGDPWERPGEAISPPLVYDRFESFDSDDGLPSDKVTTVLPIGDDLWVGTDHGVARRRDGIWESWGPADGLAHEQVTSLAVDPVSGDVWISTLGGLSVFSGGRFRSYSQRDSGLMNDVAYQVAVFGRTVWAATAAGTSVLDLRSGTWALFDHESSIMHEPWCYSLTAGGGRVWIGVWGGGIVEWDRERQSWREYRDPDKEMEIDLLRDDGPIHDVTSWVSWDSGVLWQATYFGLSRYDGRTWRTFRREDTGIPGNFINHVTGRGRIAFLGTDEGFGTTDGVFATSVTRRADGRGELRLHRDGIEIEQRILETAPAHDYVLWTAPVEGGVWLGTGEGLTFAHASASQPSREEEPR